VHGRRLAVVLGRGDGGVDQELVLLGHRAVVQRQFVQPQKDGAQLGVLLIQEGHRVQHFAELFSKGGQAFTDFVWTFSFHLALLSRPGSAVSRRSRVTGQRLRRRQHQHPRQDQSRGNPQRKRWTPYGNQ